jgi:hypothetical protein
MSGYAVTTTSDDWMSEIRYRTTRYRISRVTYSIRTRSVYMTTVRVSPGPSAAHAFRLGMIVGGLLGLTVIGVLYWIGVLQVLSLGYTLVLLFPIYLVIVACLLSVWLGYDKGPASLRRVTRNKKLE